MKTLCSFISLLIIFSSCKHNSTEFTNMPEFKKSIPDKANIYIIPGSGCTGCISNVEEMVLNNKDTTNNYFVFTRIKSIKHFKLKFGSVFNNKNIIIDSLNKFQFLEESKSIYPAKYIYSNNKFKLINYYEP